MTTSVLRCFRCNEVREVWECPCGSIVFYRGQKPKGWGGLLIEEMLKPLPEDERPGMPAQRSGARGHGPL